MTDNEIIKALKCHAENRNCGGCPLEYIDGTCGKTLCNLSLDLINRQKAEIELLQKFEKNTREERNSLWYRVQTAKAEAYKEFAERLKKHSFFDPKDQRKVVAETIIDHYLKEMVGDSNA